MRILLFVLAILPAAPVVAQDYPVRPIRMIVGLPPGGSTDIMARIVAARLSERVGQQVVVDNRPGASGMIGIDLVVKSQPDGYTLLMSGGSIGTINSLYAKAPFDVAKDLAPIAFVATSPYVLVVQPSLPIRTVAELIDYARANPARLNYAGSTPGSLQHLSGELLKRSAGIDMLYVPYKSNPQAVTDLLGGQISIFFGDVSTALPPVRAGKLKGFAVSGRKRSPLAPDLPTIDESALKGYELTAWFAAYAPAKTPKPVVDRLNAAFREALADKDVSEKLLAAGIEPEASTPDELRKFQAAETQKWKQIAADARIEPE
jgi:tripartite-type tricarboxylate transporter receptor subunit TctC